MEILEQLLAPIGRRPQPSVESWWANHLRLAADRTATVDLALAGGHGADRPAWAFASGYQAALRALLPGLPLERPVALCASEAGGAHPRAIQTRLQGGRLVGTKSFVTLGATAGSLVVLASEGVGSGGRSRLRAVLVPADRPGIGLTPGPELPFVPEVPHAVVALDCAVEPGEVLEGDGYDRYLKPFRTVEDLHVHAALVGWLLGVGCEVWPAELIERGLTIAAASRGLQGDDPSAASTWRALGGLLELANDWIGQIDGVVGLLPDEQAGRWRRDRPILGVARRARAARLKRARSL